LYVWTKSAHGTVWNPVNVTDRIAIQPSKSKLLSLYFVRSRDIHDPECRFCVLLFRLVMLIGKGTFKTEACIPSAIHNIRLFVWWMKWIKPFLDFVISLIHKQISLHMYRFLFQRKYFVFAYLRKEQNRLFLLGNSWSCREFAVRIVLHCNAHISYLICW